MSVRSARQLFSFVSLLIILSLLLPANHLPVAAQDLPAVPGPIVQRAPETSRETPTGSRPLLRRMRRSPRYWRQPRRSPRVRDTPVL